MDNLLELQVSDQMEKIETLKEVYESSMESQNSIIKFLMLNQERQSFPNFEELRADLEKLEEEQNQERKSVIIQGLNEKLEQTSQIMTLLNATLEEYKGDNKLLTKNM